MCYTKIPLQEASKASKLPKPLVAYTQARNALMSQWHTFCRRYKGRFLLPVYILIGRLRSVAFAISINNTIERFNRLKNALPC